jgi:MioC protein
MSNIQIIVGSMLGGTEYVGEACEETLNELDHKVQIHLKPDLTTIIGQTFGQLSHEKKIWIICTSTHGAGDYPDNIEQFVRDLTHCDQDLSTVSFLTIGIGDSNYDTFCYAAINITNTLKSIGLSELVSVKKLDMSLDIDPEDQAQQWILENRDQL